MRDDRHNPYAPPTAELLDGARPQSRRLGWRIYFWILLAGFVVGIPAFVYLGTVQTADVIDWLVSAVGMLGLFGYAYRRAIAARRFWAAWLPFQVLWDLLVAFLLVPRALAYAFPEAEPSTLVEDLAAFAFLVPLYVALFLYSFRSRELWEARLTA